MAFDDELDSLEEAEATGSVWVLAVYDSWRTYGGPEEGGWWFTESELTGLAGAFGSEAEGWAVAAELRHDLDLTKGQGNFTLDVVQLGRRELKPELAEELCHLDFEPGPDDYVIRWDVPVYLPERRPHYC